MSMRQHVGQREIEQFLIEVGRTRRPGRLYLTGGAALVHRGIRPGQTLEIDIQITIDPANLTTEMAQLKQKLNMNIEIASPGDFMPLPVHDHMSLAIHSCIGLSSYSSHVLIMGSYPFPIHYISFFMA
jgi:hypothetical protein